MISQTSQAQHSPKPSHASANHAANNKEDVDVKHSSRGGIAGLFETALRRFRGILHGMIMVPLYLIAGVLLGIAVYPGLCLYRFLMELTQGSASWIHDLAIAVSVGVGYFLYGFTLMTIIPAINYFVGRGLKPWRGPYYSIPAVKWYLHNGLTYLVRYTFIEMVMPGPFVNWFYAGMGMKIGKGALLNTSHISDPSMIEIGPKATIGGSATIVGHYGVGGYLIIAPVKIGKGATVGLKATIMAGVEIGENARILPNSVVLPKTHIPPGETWGGVPARKIEATQGAAQTARAAEVV